MVPDPLHPAIVHFPIVLAVLLPIFAAVAMWTIGRGTTPRRGWAAPVGLAAALALSAWLAVQTGEAQEEQVERVVAEQPLHAHEEAAETFLVASGVLALVIATGLIGGRAGTIARGLGTAAAVAFVGLAAWVGHSGGELVYRHGAASAYANPSGAPQSASRVSEGGGDDD